MSSKILKDEGFAAKECNALANEVDEALKKYATRANHLAIWRNVCL